MRLFWTLAQQDSLVDRLCGNMADIFPFTLDFEMCSNGGMIPIEGARNNIGDQIIRKSHHGPKMADDGTRDLLGIGKIA